MKRALSLIIVMVILSNMLSLVISATGKEQVFEPEQTERLGDALYTSGSRYAVANDTVYAIDSKGLYRYQNGNKQSVYSAELDSQKGFCTNGIYAYVATKNGWILRIEIATAKAQQLFSVSDLTKIAGATESELYLGRINTSMPDWWGCELYRYDFDGNTLGYIATGVEVYMDQGYLIYYDHRSDVSPTSCTAIDSNGNVVFQNRKMISTLPIVIEGKIYYLDIGLYSDRGRMVLLACTLYEQVEIANFSYNAQSMEPIITMYDGVIWMRDSAGKESYYNILTGEQIIVSAEHTGSYQLCIDEKTHSYFAKEYIWSGKTSTFSFYALANNGKLEKRSTYDGDMYAGLIYDSYVYGYQYGNDELICFSIKAGQQGNTPQTESAKDELPEGTPEAVRILVENRDVWMLQPIYRPMYGYVYGMLDFEGDGIPELYMNSCDGTLRVSENNFYKLDIKSRTVTPITDAEIDSLLGGLGDYDLRNGVVGYQSKATGKIYYLCGDFTHVSVSENSVTYGFLSIDGHNPKREALWSCYENGGKLSYEFKGQTVSDEAAWRAKQEEFLQNYVQLDISFLTADGENADESGDRKLAVTLTEIFDAFYSNVSFAPYQGEEATDVKKKAIKTTASFNEFFVMNNANNIEAMLQYESVAFGICVNDPAWQINWNQIVQAFTNTDYIDAKTLTSHPEIYYEIVLLEAIMEKQLDNNYQQALLSEAISAAASMADFFVSYTASGDSVEDVMKQKLDDTLGEFGKDSTIYKKMKQSYGDYCDALQDYETVKFIYDGVIEMNGTVGDFYERLGQYAALKNSTDDIISALEFTRDSLQHSTSKEEKNIKCAIDHVLQYYQNTYWEQTLLEFDNELQYRIRTMIWALIEGSFFAVKLGADLKDLILNTSIFLSDVIFPVSMSSEGFCKIYASYALETAFKDAMRDSYQKYLNMPTENNANITSGLYELLYKVYQHQVRVADVLAEQIYVNGFINGLRNLFSTKHMDDFRYEKSCIRAYEAYLTEIIKVRVAAQKKYDLAIGKTQPVTLVCFVNGDVLLCYTDTANTGNPYRLPIEKLGLADIFGMTAQLAGVYSNEAMTEVYDSNSTVQAPLTIFCDIHLIMNSTGERVLFDNATGISVSKEILAENTKLAIIEVASGTEYDAACDAFDGAYVELYEINLHSDGVIVQPTGEVTVTIPMAEGYDSASVYRMEADGVWTDMSASRVGDTYCFTTTHFSKYAVVYEEQSSMLGVIGIAAIALAIVVVGGSIILIAVICCVCYFVNKKNHKKRK